MTHGLVNQSDSLASLLARILESIGDQTSGIFGRDDLQALDDSLDVLVLKHGILALRVLPNDHDVYALVPRLDPRPGVAVEDVHKQVELVPHLDVAGLDVRSDQLRLDVALDPAAVASDRGDGLER